VTSPALANIYLHYCFDLWAGRWRRWWARRQSIFVRYAGMAEAFVKTFKRDYAYVQDRPDAQSVLSQLPLWFDDYNEVHPHKALRLKSRRECIRSRQQPAACPVG
jgi:Integrase core domain